MRRDPSTAARPPKPLGNEEERPVGVVLAGGASRRLGRDKALLRIDGVTLPERAARRLEAACSKIVVADAGRGLLADRRSIPDARAGGPAGGILGAARLFPERPLLVLACDTPNVPRSLIEDLAVPRPADWTVPSWERGVEPLCALYGPQALALLRRLADDGDPALHRLALRQELRIHRIEADRLARHGVPEAVFLNLNRPEDVGRLDLRLD